MATEHIAAVWHYLDWAKHNINDKTTFLFGWDCFVWMRIVKGMQLLSGIVIFKDIIGEKRVADLYQQGRVAVLAMTLKRVRHPKRLQIVGYAMIAVYSIVLLIAFLTGHSLIGNILVSILYLITFLVCVYGGILAILAQTIADKIGTAWLIGAAGLLIVSFFIDFLTS